MKIFYHHRDNSSCLLDASQIQISFVYWNGDILSSVWGNYLCRDTQKLHLPAARAWKSLSVIGRREAGAPLQLTHWTTHRPLDGICDKVILPLDYEILSAFISWQITGKVQYYIYWFSTCIQGFCVPTITDNICLLKRRGNKIISPNLWGFFCFVFVVLSCFPALFPTGHTLSLSPSY